MSIYYLICLYMIFSGLLVFCSKRKHFLLMLISLEFMILSLYCLLLIVLNFYGFEVFFCMIFLTMSVCEGALGLSILVSLVRTHGNDYFQSFNILW
uniref:NADH-ubiquinone oxidoreductase chain 4L n=1 Tax=Trachys variolaris TaxID=2823040 RepID=A0A8A6W533_9COLE|nr:NADH dehydrogenase subunit 4L [Trachys variolaris]QTK22445.1 NADH dehydrogenase subunit 4L [Trachys variolaris]